MRPCPRWLHLYGRLLWASTAFLLIAGALVTGTGSGLAVPDWPLSFGQYMPPMVGGVFYEHGHRMVAGTVGILTLVLASFTLVFERRLSVRILAVMCLFVVVVQAVLGGLTVIYRLPTSVSVTHACVAQCYFALVTLFVTVTSDSWIQSSRIEDKGLSRLAEKGVVLVFLQILLGAIMRHYGAGLAIPDFPKMFGSWIPPLGSFETAIHFFHRAVAILVTCHIFFLLFQTQRRAGSVLWLVGLSGLLTSLVLIQFFLGMLVIWTGKSVGITTAHLLFGGICFSSLVAYAAIARRLEGRELSPLWSGKEFRKQVPA